LTKITSPAEIPLPLVIQRLARHWTAHRGMPVNSRRAAVPHATSEHAFKICCEPNFSPGCETQRSAAAAGLAATYWSVW
jgi:uncharacterized protein (DUF169 family)